MVDQALFNRLRKAMRSGQITRDREDLSAYSCDATKERALPEAVARVRTKEEVAALLKVANDVGLPVYPRGAGTEDTGGAPLGSPGGTPGGIKGCLA